MYVNKIYSGITSKKVQTDYAITLHVQVKKQL